MKSAWRQRDATIGSVCRIDEADGRALRRETGLARRLPGREFKRGHSAVAVRPVVADETLALRDRADLLPAAIRCPAGVGSRASHPKDQGHQVAS